jgi:glutathione S-transferase
VLQLLERHFHRCDYVLGGRPSLADLGLLGPLYAHL